MQTKENAWCAIFSAILESPSCADDRGICTLILGPQMYQLKPKKKRKDDEI